MHGVYPAQPEGDFLLLTRQLTSQATKGSVESRTPLPMWCHRSAGAGIMVSARDSEIAKVGGMERGPAAYVTTPYSAGSP